jgi:uncharacterized membrane-anchored protein YhcB (DUF1043 family)
MIRRLWQQIIAGTVAQVTIGHVSVRLQSDQGGQRKAPGKAKERNKARRAERIAREARVPVRARK